MGLDLVLALLTSVLDIAWYWALAKGGISRIASIQFTQPLFGIALAAIVLGERPARITAVAAAAILLGAWMVLRAGSEQAGRHRRDRVDRLRCRLAHPLQHRRELPQERGLIGGN